MLFINKICLNQILTTFNKLTIVSFVYYAKSKIGKRNNYLLSVYMSSLIRNLKKYMFYTYCIESYIRVFLIKAYLEDSFQNVKIKAADMICVV